MRLNVYLLCLLLLAGMIGAQPLPHAATPEDVGLDSRHLAYADDVVLQSVRAGEIPGAVLAVVRQQRIAYLKAYGNKQVFPDTVPMRVNTVFDLASVSKSVSTALSVMILLERGRLRLLDDVSLYVPDFRPWTDSVTGEQQTIRLVHLLTHTSGLPPYAPVDELKLIYTTPNPNGLMEYIAGVRRNSAPGTAFDYSCLNFITLQHVIENVSGMSLQAFARAHIFEPLKMVHTDYNPTGETLQRTAPTERQPDGLALRGLVHDPLARVMNGGVSGNAGLFSDAADLAALAAMLLNDGVLNGVRILHPLTVRAMRSVPAGYEAFGRALGWDVASGYAKDGDLFDVSAYGHTGYTGTSITLDPETSTAVILLTNRVHPEDKNSVSRLRDCVANVVAASILRTGR